MPARNARRRTPRRPTLPAWRPPKLEQRHLDLIGLGLIALAAFFAFVIYASWDGGRAGAQAAEGLRWLLGDV